MDKPHETHLVGISQTQKRIIKVVASSRSAFVQFI